MIQAGADLASPASSQPDSRVITIGASSERLPGRFEKLVFAVLIDDVAEFVMAFILSGISVGFFPGPSLSSGC
jgi:hypothetical protein